MTVRDPVSVERPAAKRIQNVRMVPVHRHTDWEGAARPDDLAQFQPVAEDPEHGHGVTARVDREQQPMPVVVRQRPLGRQVVDHRAAEDPAEAAGRVGARQRQRAVRRAMVGGHRVARGVVGLHEDGAGVPPVSGAGGRRRERRRRQGRHGQHADADGGHETTEYLHEFCPFRGESVDRTQLRPFSPRRGESVTGRRCRNAGRAARSGTRRRCCPRTSCPGSTRCGPRRSSRAARRRRGRGTG